MPEDVESTRRDRVFPLPNEIFKTRQRWRAVMGYVTLISPFLAVGLVLFGILSDSSPLSDFFSELNKYHESSVLPLLFGFMALCLVLLFISGRFFRTWQDCQELTADEAIKADARNPILYLRPFTADKITMTTLEARAALTKRSYATKFGALGLLFFAFLWGYGYGRKRRAEELIVDLLSPRGPVIAIGRPGEKIPKLGASRVYVGDNWKEVIRDYMSRSQLVVMFGGTTPGFAWEITEVFRNAPFVPTILLLPFTEQNAGEEMDKFVDIFRSRSTLAIPSDLRRIRAIYFPSSGDRELLSDLGTEGERSLNEQNPFLSALGRILHREEPAWVGTAATVAKEQNKATKSNLRWWTLIPIGLLLLRLLMMLSSC